MTTPTPRTDAEVVFPSCNDDSDTSHPQGTHVDADFARTLERELATERQKARTLREACERLRDCDWVITLPNRMDAVRDIARAAIDAAMKEETK